MPHATQTAGGVSGCHLSCHESGWCLELPSPVRRQTTFVASYIIEGTIAVATGPTKPKNREKQTNETLEKRIPDFGLWTAITTFGLLRPSSGFFDLTFFPRARSPVTPITDDRLPMTDYFRNV
jgi:hypothetical protein